MRSQKLTWIENRGAGRWGNLVGGVPPLGPLGDSAPVSQPRLRVPPLHFDGLLLCIAKSVEELELLLLYFLPLLSNSSVTQCLLKWKCWRGGKSLKRAVWWGEWEMRPTCPSARLCHLPPLIWALSPQVMMKKRMLESSCQTVEFGVNKISMRDLQEARKLMLTCNQGEFEPMSPDLKV